MATLRRFVVTEVIFRPDPLGVGTGVRLELGRPFLTEICQAEFASAAVRFVEA